MECERNRRGNATPRAAEDGAKRKRRRFVRIVARREKRDATLIEPARIVRADRPGSLSDQLSLSRGATGLLCQANPRLVRDACHASQGLPSLCPGTPETGTPETPRKSPQNQPGTSLSKRPGFLPLLRPVNTEVRRQQTIVGDTPSMLTPDFSSLISDLFHLIPESASMLLPSLWEVPPARFRCVAV